MSILENKIIFDVGANNGDSFIQFAINNPDSTVYGFEPTPKLADYIRSIKPQNYVLIQKAVSNYNGISKFKIAGQSNWGCSSLLDFSDKSKTDWYNRSDFVVTEEIDVEVIRLDKFIKDNNISKIDYLHIDAQGSDLNVLKGLGEYISIIVGGSLEASSIKDILYNGQNSKEESIDFLQNNNFVIKGVYPNDGQYNEANISFEYNSNIENPNIAMCISGQSRGWKNFRISDWVKENYKIFIHTWNDKYLESNKELINKFKPSGLLIEENKDFTEDIKLYNCREGRHYKSCLPMYYSIKKCSDLLEKHVFETKEKFDIVIRTRFDSRPNYRINYELTQGIFTPIDRNKWSICDQIAYGDYNSMLYYSRCYDFIIRAKEENRADLFLLDPECVLRQHLNYCPRIPKYQFELSYGLDRLTSIQKLI